MDGGAELPPDSAGSPSESGAGPKYTTPGLDPRTGRFAKGNKLSKGNVLARRVARLRAEILREEKPQDVHSVIAAMRAKALEGDATAAKVYLDRVMGPVTPFEVESRIAELEGQLASAIELLRNATAANNAQPALTADVRMAG